MYLARSVAPVGESRRVYGNQRVASTRGDLVELIVRQRYGIFSTRPADRRQQRNSGDKTKKPTTHRTLYKNVGDHFKDRVGAAPLFIITMSHGNCSRVVITTARFSEQ
jgi:hypothetical protein